MELDTFIITCFCLIDDSLLHLLGQSCLRQRGFPPTLSDTEVLTMEVVGTYLGLTQDEQIYSYFRRHWTHFFPRLLHIHRTTFVRQAANLWKVKERLWQECSHTMEHGEGIVDSVPIPVCQFARAPWCSRFKGGASFGKDHATRQTFYGFRLHLRTTLSGAITHASLVPANVQEGAVVPELTAGTTGVLLGDRNYWIPQLKEELKGKGITLLAPFRSKKHQPPHSWSPILGKIRFRIETVFGQLVDRCGLKRVWARDLWHLWNRLLRMLLMHTLCLHLNLDLGNPPLSFALLTL